jgi:hypothetical protein
VLLALLMLLLLLLLQENHPLALLLELLLLVVAEDLAAEVVVALALLVEGVAGGVVAEAAEMEVVVEVGVEMVMGPEANLTVAGVEGGENHRFDGMNAMNYIKSW